jgi:hypothetical protein
MLSLVALVDQWREIQDILPEDWREARLRVIVADAGDCDRASALLGPLNPGRRGKVIAFAVQRGAADSSPERARRLLARLDSERVSARLALVGVVKAEAAAQQAGRASAVASQWDAAAAELPADWSDVYGELELASSDYLERGALLLAPLNPARVPERLAYRFRIARRFGYGASATMARRCFERLDAENIRGELRVLWALSDTKPVYTQGPVWYAGGRAV